MGALIYDRPFTTRPSPIIALKADSIDRLVQAQSVKKMKRPWDAIVWWEIRRIPYNVTLAILGMVAIGAVLWLGSNFAAAGGIVSNPLGLIVGVVLYGLAANVFYTLGWISELLWSDGDTSRTESLRRRVFLVGLIASCAITLSPVVLIPSLWLIFSFQQGPLP